MGTGQSLRPLVLFLLGTLDEAERADDRWREIVQLVRHEGGNGAEVREAARRFTEGRPDLRKWLDSLAISRTPDWQIKQERKRLAENTKLERQWLEHRDHFLRNRGALRAGVGSYAVPPAQAYLGLFDDVGRDRPANERIAEWLGTDLQADAFEGFERFLTASPPDLTAEAVAKSHANNLHYPKAAILVAAIAERLRNNVGTGNIPDNQLVTALLEIKNQYLDQRPGIECLSDAIEDEVRRRTGTWEMFQRLRVEPSLANNCASNPGLVDLMREQRDTALAEHLAVEWLTKHPNMHVEHEGEMIDRLVRSGQFDQLRVLSTSRRTSADPSRERLWNAIALLTDFEVASTRLQGIGATDPDFLWTLQERFFGDRSSYRHGYSSAAVSPQLMAWIVREFREGYPPCGLPSDGWHGSNNPWDAADFIAALIKRLGNDTRREAVQELASLGSNGGDGYTELILASSAEQRAKRADQDYRPPTLAEIKAVLTLGPPASVKDLQTIMLEEIDSVQDKIHSDNIDSWRNFFTDDDRPQPEERCRDALIGLLRQGCDGVELTPEDHLADDKEADIGCRAGGLFLPIEVNRLLQKSIAARLWR